MPDKGATRMPQVECAHCVSPNPVDDAAVEAGTAAKTADRPYITALETELAEARASLVEDRAALHVMAEERDAAMAERDEAVARAEKVERERDLTATHVRRQAAALDLAKAQLRKAVARAEKAEAEVEQAERERNMIIPEYVRHWRRRGEEAVARAERAERTATRLQNRVLELSRAEADRNA